MISVKNKSNRIVRNESKYSVRTLPVLLKNPKILLIGGGAVAYQKAKVLVLNNIDFLILSVSVNDKIKSLDAPYRLKKFERSDIKGFNIVIDATGKDDVARTLIKLKSRKFFLLNVVDKPEDCDFYFSSLLVYNNVKIAVSSNGGSPTLTQVIRDKIKEIIPPDVGIFSELKLIERSNNIVDVERTKKEIKELFGKVSLVGCGPGDPELLTLKALKIIQNADIILYDNKIDENLLSLTKESAEKFCVGKQKGHYSFRQDEINKVMLEFAKSGCHVARLKGGDPYIFGRGAEEAEYLLSNNIKVEVIPGISSAFAAPLLAGIPPTHRSYSSAVTVVTGYNKNGKLNLNWIDLLNLKNHTIIVLMGVTAAREIQVRGIECGIRKELPVAIISNASKQNQNISISTFNNFAKLAENTERPAIIVFGEVVKMHYKLSHMVQSLNNHSNKQLIEIPIK